MTTSARSTVEKKLRKAWRRERRFVHLRGLFRLLVAAVALVLLDLALDWLFELPGALRILLVAANVAVLLWIAVRYWWRDLRSFEAARVALRVETKYGGLQSLLVSHVQIGRGEGDLAGSSPRLVEAMHAQAEEVTSPLDFKRLVDFRRLRKLAVTSLAAVVLFGLSLIVATDFYRVLLLRLLDPSSSIGYPTRTRIEEVSGDRTVQQGEPLVLFARVSGEIPAAGRLEVRYPGGSWERIEVARAEENPVPEPEPVPVPVPVPVPEPVPDSVSESGSGSDAVALFAHRFDAATREFEYAFRVGDARSGVHRVSVVPIPRIEEIAVTLEPPEYTGESSSTTGRLNVEALEGTRIEWDLLLDQPLASAWMVRDEGAADELEIDAADPRRVRGSHVATSSLTYRFEWVDRDHGFRSVDPVHYSVRVVPDRPPRVEMLSPRQDDKATLQKELAIEFRVRDDYGVEEGWIVYSLNDGAEAREPIGSLRELGGETGVTLWRPRESIPELKETDVIQYAIEASDNRGGDGSPNLGRSRSLRLEFVSVEEYLKYVAEKKAQLFSNIKGVLEEETQASRNVKTLKEETR